MPLTEVKVRNAKPKDKPYKSLDGHGLFLLVTPDADSAKGRLWRMKYRCSRKEKLIALGNHPLSSLKEAREFCIDARKKLAHGIDPSAHRKASIATRGEKQANTFEVVAREWHERRKDNSSEGHAQRTMERPNPT